MRCSSNVARLMGCLMAHPMGHSMGLSVAQIVSKLACPSSHGTYPTSHTVRCPWEVVYPIGYLMEQYISCSWAPGCPSHAISCIARDVHGVDHERLLIPLGTSWDIRLYLMLMGTMISHTSGCPRTSCRMSHGMHYAMARDELYDGPWRLVYPAEGIGHSTA